MENEVIVAIAALAIAVAVLLLFLMWAVIQLGWSDDSQKRAREREQQLRFAQETGSIGGLKSQADTQRYKAVCETAIPLLFDEKIDTKTKGDKLLEFAKKDPQTAKGAIKYGWRLLKREAKSLGIDLEM